MFARVRGVGRLALLAALACAVEATEAAAQQQGRRVFALLVLDTDSGVVGAEEDGLAMESVLRQGFAGSDLLRLRILRGAEVQPRLITDHFRAIPSGPGDVVFLYYSGHGATVEGRGHVLTTSHGALPRADLRAAMAARRARLTVLLTDCCANVVKLPSAPMAATPAAPRPEVSPLLRCLFLQHRGRVDLTSSSFGESSWGDSSHGGFFTYALSRGLGNREITLVDGDEDGFVTWTELFALVRRETQQVYRDFRETVMKEARQRPGLARFSAELREQPDQVPQAFALGDHAGQGNGNGPSPVSRAPNLGIRFAMVDVGDARGARLVDAPDPGSGASQLQLEPGDTILTLDALPVREAVDVMNHHGRTTVVFNNVRTGRPQAGVMNLPAYTPPPPEAPREHHAATLGIAYQLLPYGDAFGARVCRTPRPGSAGALLQLERGDMIVALDGQPITRPEDLQALVARTTVAFVNIRSGKLQSAEVQLPGAPAR